MKLHPRIRKAIKWGGAVVTVLLIVMWAVTLRTNMMYVWPSGRGLVAANGQIGILSMAQPMGWIGFNYVENSAASTAWWFSYVQTPGHSQLRVPFWLPVAIGFGIAGAARRFDTLARRRAKLNLCPNCGYDRTGLRDGENGIAQCPECGAATASV